MSMHIDRYRPMCARCHSLFDNWVARGNHPGRWTLEVRDQLIEQQRIQKLDRDTRRIARMLESGGLPAQRAK
jgi:hypothetical protein